MGCVQAVAEVTALQAASESAEQERSRAAEELQAAGARLAATEAELDAAHRREDTLQQRYCTFVCLVPGKSSHTACSTVHGLQSVCPLLRPILSCCCCMM